MKVVVIGAGYVGLPTAVALAYLGHDVVCVEKDPAKLTKLTNRIAPIQEPGLQNLMTVVADKLHFCDSAADAVAEADVIMIAVGTPSKANGEADLSFVQTAANEAARALRADRCYTLVTKSTVPIGSNRLIARTVHQVLQTRGAKATVRFASNPEFLREGRAISDTLFPDRVLVGVEDSLTAEVLRDLYGPILTQNFPAPAGINRPVGYALPPFVTCDLITTELTKYAANAFLALKISFINEIAGLCDRVGADVVRVAHVMGLDSRIGDKFLSAGLGWGGSCFPKDTAALLAISQEYDYSMPMVEATRHVNDRQRLLVLAKLQSALKVLRGQRIAVLGLAFKPDTDDIRQSPSVALVRLLVDRGASVVVHDPVALANAREELGNSVEISTDLYEAVSGAVAVVIATEWHQYRQLDWARIASSMRRPLLLDARNCCNPDEVRSNGMEYLGVGRS